jgi:hypothetical protein
VEILEHMRSGLAQLPLLAKFAIALGIMVLVTSIMGPVLTQRFAPRMLEPAPDRPALDTNWHSAGILHWDSTRSNCTA